MKENQAHMREIYFFNDHSNLNIRYRSCLIKKLSLVSLVKSVGWKNTPFSFLFGLVFSKSYGFSSNAKTNILVLMFRSHPTVILFNGLGRFRSSKILRAILIRLILKSRKKIVIFQNYLDYRYFRINCTSAVLWVPGSGGVRRRHPGNQAYGIVTRPEKLRLCKGALLNVSNQNFVHTSGHVNIIGIEADPKNFINSASIRYAGYVPQEQLFSLFSSLIQLPGYGEGIPHCLVDAIVSDMRVIITKKQYIEFGFYKLGFGVTELSDGWFELECRGLSESVRVATVNSQYMEALTQLQSFS